MSFNKRNNGFSNHNMNQYSRQTNYGNYRHNGSGGGGGGVQNGGGYYQNNFNNQYNQNPHQGGYRRTNKFGNNYNNLNYQKPGSQIHSNNMHQFQRNNNNYNNNHNNHHNNHHHNNHQNQHHHNPNHHNHHHHHSNNHHHQSGYVPPPVPQQYNKPDPNFKEVNGAAFFIGQLDKTVNRDTVYNEIIRHSKQAAKGQGFYVRRMCMPTANSSTGTGNCGFAIVHTRSAEEANYVLRLGKLRIAGKDCQVQAYTDRRTKKDSGNTKTTNCLKTVVFEWGFYLFGSFLFIYVFT